VTLVEPNENQNYNRKVKTAQSLELAAKVAEVFKLPTFREGLLIAVCFGLLITLLQINLFPRALDIKVGQVSKLDIRAPRDVIDREATKLAQKEAVDNALAIAKQDLNYYLIDETVAKSVTYKLNQFFETINYDRENLGVHEGSSFTKENFQASRYQSYFAQTPDFSLIKSILGLEAEHYQELKEKAYQILARLESDYKITNTNIEAFRDALPEIISEYQVSPKVKEILTGLLKLAVRPNLVLDEGKISKLKNEVMSKVPPVIHRRDDLIIAKNQVVTDNDLKMLNELHLIVDESNRVKVFLSLSLLVLLLVGLVLIYMFQFYSALFRQERMLYLILLLLLLVLGIVKALSLVDSLTLPYLAPVSFASMLMTILVNPQLALAMTCVISLLCGMIVEYNLALSIFFFVSGIVAVLTLVNFSRQRDLVRSGSILMVSNAVTVILLNLLFRTTFDYVSVVLAVGNGFFSAVLAIGSLPFIENIFKMTSPIRLLELSNPGHPLLRRLQIEAPGTYHHSIMVGNLAEAAAQGIGADALWVRVGSYYHDIGKIKRPYFFVENQFGQENPHERLNPTLSTLIITYHVKEGVEIAKEHGLPDKIIEIIEQHHGTDLVRYFYNKASENLSDEKGVLVEEDFRYDGPKPQTKEAALVMLADSVEAAVRSMPKPTPAKIEALIQKIIRERLDDGQFDECNLTLKELTVVKNSLLKILEGSWHTRVEYPEKVLKEMERKKTNASIAK